ncbi:MAG: hypothetical protein EOP04_19715, partial [Proteobacteria bacterium]
MIAVCHKCGSAKAEPILRCVSCKFIPASDEDLALAFMLTDRFLSPDKLDLAAHLIKKGQPFDLPPNIKSDVIATIRASRTQRARKGFDERFEEHEARERARNQQRSSSPKKPHPTPPRRQSKSSIKTKRTTKIKIWSFIAIIATILLIIFHPWPHFQWAIFQNNISSYERFAHRFPSSDYTDFAHDKIHVLRESEVWSRAKRTGQIEMFRDYVSAYPDGKHLDEAETRISKLADAQWQKIDSSRSVSAINKFLAHYPETSMMHAAEQRIQELYNDWNWVREHDSLDHYQRFAARYPNHPERRWIEKRIIDLEVKEIAAGEYGEMPRAQPVRYGGSTAEVSIENQTGYELTVRYSG